MVVSIMQPYFFPYLGYFQLLAASDAFVILDDAQYIKGGWVNRNRILFNDAPAWIIRPVVHAAYTLPINQRDYVGSDVPKRLLRQIDSAYRKAPRFTQARDLVEPLIAWPDANIARFNTHLIRTIAETLGLPAKIVVSSEFDKDHGLQGQDRVFDICKRLGATHYVNSPGGTSLYQREVFERNGLELRFLQPQIEEYRQFGDAHVPGLSIIDTLMFNDLEAVRRQCEQFRLVEGT